jgi:K+-sensing histidine kinase KdpD
MRVPSPAPPEDAYRCGHSGECARRYGVTQVFVPRQKGQRRWIFGRPSLAEQIVHLARDLQVTVIADRRKRG